MIRAVALVGLMGCWAGDARSDTLIERYPTPAGWHRAEANDFGEFLRASPLAASGTPVRSFAGDVIQHRYADAVFELDVGTKDLQQCADSVLRLWAEYIRDKQPEQLPHLHFHATSGDDMPFARYQAGERFRVDNSDRLALVPASFSSDEVRWRTYLSDVFTYAGSRSLARDTSAAAMVQPGDVLVDPGSPGHVVLVLDVATDIDGSTRYLVGQGFMPAQSFHVLIDDDGSPWWRADQGLLRLPSWPTAFGLASARRLSLPLTATGATTTPAGRRR
jgi:hypothetical protein